MAGQVKNLIGIRRLRTPFVRTAKGKGVYGRYHSATSNLANLNLCSEDNATRRLRGLIIFKI